MTSFLKDPISNGNPREQAIIRKWWHEECHAEGKLVWEYYLEGKYADAIWFPEHLDHGQEHPGVKTSTEHPIDGHNVILCEAKIILTPEVIGQALVYTTFAARAGANVVKTIVFAEEAPNPMITAASDLGLETVVGAP